MDRVKTKVLLFKWDEDRAWPGGLVAAAEFVEEACVDNPRGDDTREVADGVEAPDEGPDRYLPLDPPDEAAMVPLSREDTEEGELGNNSSSRLPAAPFSMPACCCRCSSICSSRKEPSNS